MYCERTTSGDWLDNVRLPAGKITIYFQIYNFSFKTQEMLL